MAAINLAGAAIQMAFQKNLSDGITAMFTFFKHTDPMPAGHDTLSSLVQYSTFRPLADIQPGDYFFVPPITNGPNPSLANLANPNQFQLVAVRVTAIGNSFLTVQRSVPLNNNDSAATADANALATYGVIHNRLYFPIPGVVDGIEQIQLLVATQTLLDIFSIRFHLKSFRLLFLPHSIHSFSPIYSLSFPSPVSFPSFSFRPQIHVGPVQLLISK